MNYENIDVMSKQEMRDHIILCHSIILGYMTENKLKEIIAPEPSVDNDGEVILAFHSGKHNGKYAFKVTLNPAEDFH